MPDENSELPPLEQWPILHLTAAETAQVHFLVSVDPGATPGWGLYAHHHNPLQANEVYENLRAIAVVGDEVFGYNDNRETDERGHDMPTTPAETAWDNLTNGQMVVIDEHFGTPAPQWIREHASTVGFIHDNRDRNTFYRSLWSGLQRHHSLTVPQYNAVQSDRRRAESGDTTTPTARVGWAMADDLPYIYNGKYTIEHDGEHITIQIHTVRQGGLTGQRIVKRAMYGGTFKGFGTLLQDGTLYLWRNQSELEGTKVVEFTKVLLRMMSAAHNAGSDIVWNQFDGENHRATVVMGGDSYELWLARRCRRCNRELTNPQSVQDGIGPECSQRETAADRSVAARQADPAASRTRRPASTPAARRTSTSETYGQARDRHAASSTATALLSELGSGELL